MQHFALPCPSHAAVDACYGQHASHSTHIRNSRVLTQSRELGACLVGCCARIFFMLQSPVHSRMFTLIPRTASHCTALHCTALHCTAPHRTAPHRTAPYRPPHTGIWEWEPTLENATLPFNRTLNRSILVPFPPESCLSGIRENHPFMQVCGDALHCVPSVPANVVCLPCHRGRG
jgi:hypothetical protein